MGQLPGPAVSHHTSYLHNTMNMCILVSAAACLTLSRCLPLSPSLCLSYYLFSDSHVCGCLSTRECTLTHTYTQTCACAHAHSGSGACSSWVFCGLDSHQCFLWLHYCYLNVGGRSAASINGILSSANATHTHTKAYTHRRPHMHVRTHTSTQALWMHLEGHMNNKYLCHLQYHRVFPAISAH